MPEQGIPISDAAQIMGVSVDALRKRVQRRSVRAYKGTDGQWRVVLSSVDATGTPPVAETPSETSEEIATSAVIGTPDERFARVIEQAIAPYAARLEAVSREAGELRARLEQTARERDELRLRLDARASERSGEESHIGQGKTPQEGVQRETEASWRVRLRRWVGWE